MKSSTWSLTFHRALTWRGFFRGFAGPVAAITPCAATVTAAGISRFNPKPDGRADGNGSQVKRHNGQIKLCEVHCNIADRVGQRIDAFIKSDQGQLSPTAALPTGVGG